MLGHEVWKLVPFKGLINHLDQLGVLLVISLLVILVVDVENPLTVALELIEGLIELLILLLFIETFLKQEVFDGRL
jgi:uncharacterized protein YqhQ